MINYNPIAKILLSLFILLSMFCCYSVDFVLFTQPKTGTHLISGILFELTNRNIYWPRQYINFKHVPQAEQKYSDHIRYILYSPDKHPWTMKTMNTVWSR